MKKFFFMIFSLCMLNVSAQNIAVNTDLLMDAAVIPSLGVEMTMTKRSTLGLNMMYSPNALYKAGKVFEVMPEWRFYFSGRPMYRHFVGLTAMWADYNLTFNNKHHEGNASGVGVSFGYVWNIKDRWSVDFHSSLGAAFYKQKEWENGNPHFKDQAVEDYGYVPANEHGTVFVPLRLGVSVTYMIR